MSKAPRGKRQIGRPGDRMRRFVAITDGTVSSWAVVSDGFAMSITPFDVIHHLGGGQARRIFLMRAMPCSSVRRWRPA